MPRENKKRGRRGADSKKRKHTEDEAEEFPAEAAASSPALPSGKSSNKRRKSTSAAVAFTTDGTTPPPPDQDETYYKDGQEGGGEEAEYYDQEGGGGEQEEQPFERAFFGVLDEQEQEYFRHADDLLEANSFADPDDRATFLANVYREAGGKELKIAQSQSCSRLMERLILLSGPAQLKGLFGSFDGNFIHLITHRFASHACEALFRKAAPVVAEELKAPNGKAAQEGDEDAEQRPMESFFLDTLAEIEGSVGYLLTDPYASHVLRVLLIVLSGDPIDTPQTKRLLQSKRKETNSVQQTAEPSEKTSSEATRSVPQSFTDALQRLISESIAGLDTEKLRALATHRNGNPTLQLLLRLELTHFGKQRAKDETSVIRTLLPDDPITADSGSASFINGLVYDTVGSHLVERIIEHAPGKMFKTLYQQFFKERLAAHARNEVAGYVACRVLERLGPDDLLEAHELLIPHITSLLQKNRTVVIRTLIERCQSRDIDTKAIAAQVDNTWHGEDGFEVKKLIKFDAHEAALDSAQQQHRNVSSANTEGASSTPFTRNTDSVKTHFNLLAQSMLLVPGSLSALVLDSLVTLDTPTLLAMSRDPIVSRTLQAALTTKNSSMITTRKLIQHFYGRIGELALEPAASHVVDCIWEGTHGLAHLRERIAEELAENEAALRVSPCGRAVWRNWKMDLYKRRRADWIRKSREKATNDGFQSFSELDAIKENAAGDGHAASPSSSVVVEGKSERRKKTPIEIARERHVKKSAGRERKGSDRASASRGDRSARRSRDEDKSEEV